MRLAKWCETACEKITEDMESLEMHSAVRNVMRLFDRIKDFEKRVLARQSALGRADREALIEALALLAADARPVRSAPGRGAVDRVRRTTSTARRRRGRAYRCRCQHEHAYRNTARASRPADALVRDRPRLPPLRSQLPARGDRVRVPGLRQGAGRRLRLRARRPPLQGGAAARSARRTSGTSRSCCRSSTPPRRRGWAGTPATRR